MRARDLGLRLTGDTGPHNAITDVPGVEVGYTTLVSGDAVRTGVTAILPRAREDVHLPCAAGRFSLNGNGEMTGSALIDEIGSVRLPVLITNTHAIGPCHRGVIDWVAREKPAVAEQWLLPVVAETWDGYLNDINGPHIQPAHAVAAIDAAAGGPVAEGSVGGGTGMNCYAFKGGSGTSSRTVHYGSDAYTVGAFVQANFGSRKELTVCGVPVGADLADDNPMEDGDWMVPPGAGSVIVVIATDAPMLPGQCTALARRVPLGLARTGTTGSHFSGDLFLAFSTGNVLTPSAFPTGDPGYDTLRHIPWNRMDDFFTAVVHAVEEAVLNALVAGKTMTGRLGRRSPALPIDRLQDLVLNRS
ncbi:P1 family peptidase [Actinokineospora globicatena]|uniref:DmpA family aminopeptidase n=1 Tax=Actinokineospora globicatena TaxID=103729 RepID=UPI0020A27441|nr:P1 family peptidase [Actinokineospora globicatena]MCP2306742.1 L-aminopeptidase/D-esterase [Actinokineospora globicatena]GLW82139.1 aminopeptidase [Actinokineospora globicatena]GLW88932.1 aminopeptidase [Actinokineospora globicatena]